MAGEENQTSQICSQYKTFSKQKQLKANLGTVSAEKVLSVSAEPTLEETTFENSKLNLKGSVQYKVVYQDNEGKFDVLEYDTNFDDTVELKGVGDNCKYIANIENLETELKPIKEDGEVNVENLLQFNIDVFACENIEVYCEKQDDENLRCLKQENMVYNITNNTSVEFENNGIVELGANVIKLLDVSNFLTNIESVCQNGKFVVSGEILTNVLYLSIDEKNAIQTKQNSVDFRYEIEEENLEETDNVITNLSIAKNKVKTQTVQSGDNLNIELSCPIQCNYAVVKKQAINSIADAYSLTNEINIEEKEYNSVIISPVYKFNEQLRSSVELENDYQTIERVVGHNGQNIVITKSQALQDTIQFEGIFYTNIIFDAFDRNTETNSTTSLIAEIPFAFTLNQKGINEQDNIVLKCNLDSVDVRAKRTQEFDVISQIQIYANIIKNNNISITSNIEFSAVKEQNPNALSMYLYEKGKSLWDIAKELSTTKEVLEAQNTTLQFPLAENSRIILYRQKRQ